MFVNVRGPAWSCRLMVEAVGVKLLYTWLDLFWFILLFFGMWLVGNSNVLKTRLFTSLLLLFFVVDYGVLLVISAGRPMYVLFIFSKGGCSIAKYIFLSILAVPEAGDSRGIAYQWREIPEYISRTLHGYVFTPRHAEVLERRIKRARPSW
jgi:hypothetical protein